MLWKRLLVLSLLAGALAGVARSQSPPVPMEVHEWGTFTSLEDESGQAIGGINTDDEPVPSFVHSLAPLIQTASLQGLRAKAGGTAPCDPDVTMRLETPVIYFHPGPETPRSPIDVSVQWRGGWLTQFYPNAAATAPGLSSIRPVPLGTITECTLGNLTWAGLTLDPAANGPATLEHVWTAPRNVTATSIRTPAGEAEKYLFYRGIGHLEGPVRVVRGPSRLEIHADGPPTMYSHLWLVDIHADGSAAFQSGDSPLGTLPDRFAADRFAPANLTRLRDEMQAALVADGLFEDEARAMLATWELSYFKSPGMRIFYLVPRTWTDQVLPLQISVPTRLARVMVGRIEVVTPEQRRLLKQIARDPAPHGSAQQLQMRLLTSSTYQQAFQDLGRFRNALLLDEARRRPTRALKTFIELHGLNAYHQVEPVAVH